MSTDTTTAPAEPQSHLRVVHCKKAPAGTFRYIGRPTIFGNPYALTNPRDEAARAAVIDNYRTYFVKRIAADTHFAAEVETLRGHDLGCWCAPRPCHGDVILDWLTTHPTEHPDASGETGALRGAQLGAQ